MTITILSVGRHGLKLRIDRQKVYHKHWDKQRKNMLPFKYTLTSVSPRINFKQGVSMCGGGDSICVGVGIEHCRGVPP